MQEMLVLTDQTYLYDFSYKKRVDLVASYIFGGANFKVVVFGFVDTNKSAIDHNHSVINLTSGILIFPKWLRFLISAIRTHWFLRNSKGEVLVENLLSAFPLILNSNIVFRIDLHGDVVDELRLLKGFSNLTLSLLYVFEKKILQKSKSISVCSYNHKKALEYKLNFNNKNLDVIPNISIDSQINNFEIIDIEFEEFIKSKNCLIYSGSSLKWQNPENVILFFSELLKISDQYRLVILSKDKKAFNSIIKNRFKKISSFIYLTSVEYKNVGYYYSKCKFGLIFRDFSRTNFVSSPTKVVEYAKFNLRILYSGFIGDFLDDNIENVHLINCDHFALKMKNISDLMSNSLELPFEEFKYPRSF